jgi:predicted PurR-regulated permease PerM
MNHMEKCVLNTKGENKSTDVHVSNGWGSRRHVQPFVLMAATILGVYLCFQMALPFLPAVTWALTLAVLFTPFQRRLEARRMCPGLAAAISVAIAILVVAAPATFIGKQLVQQAASGAELINAKVASGEWQRAIEAQPRLASLVDLIERYIDLPGTVKTFSDWLSTFAGPIVTGSVIQLIGFCITFYMLFFFLRDRKAALQALRSLSPIPVAETDLLFSRVSDTIYATVYGTLAVSILQGFLGGLMFWWLGLTLPLLWGVVMAFLALVPALGVFVVWIPAAVFLALEGSLGKAVILSLWGGIVVGSVDNLLRPILMGKRLKFHTILVFMSLVGGLLVFGASGIILGPVTLTVATVLLESWRDKGSSHGGIHKSLHFALYESKMYQEADVSRRTPRKPGFSPRHESVLGLCGILHAAKVDIAGCNIQENLSPFGLRIFLAQERMFFSRRIA